jgi:hypothetical protein
VSPDRGIEAGIHGDTARARASSQTRDQEPHAEPAPEMHASAPLLLVRTDFASRRFAPIDGNCWHVNYGFIANGNFASNNRP